MIYSLLFHLARVPFSLVSFPFSGSGFKELKRKESTFILDRARLRSTARILREFRRDRLRFARIASLSAAFSEGDAVPQIRPSLLQQSFNPRPRFAAPRADVIHYSTRRCSCLRVLVADITFTHGHANAYSHGHVRARAHVHTHARGTASSPVAVSENSRHRRSDARARAHCPRQAVLCNFSLDSSSLFLSSLPLSATPSLFLAVFAKSAFLLPPPDSLVSLYSYASLRQV